MNQFPRTSWEIFSDLQSHANSTVLNSRAWAVDDALGVLLDGIESGEVGSDPEKIYRQFNYLVGNRAAKFRRRNEILYELWQTSTYGASDPADMAADRVRLQRIRKKVTNDEWNLLEQIALGHSYEEIAECNGLTAEGIKPKVSRLRARLRAHLPNEMETEAA